MTSEPEADPVPEPANSYDALPYDSWAFDVTHPDRLAAFGAFFQIDVADVDTCRVLELGCAAGGNVIPMAVSLPNAHFVGVDLSAVQIAQGQKTIEALGLTNVTLEQRSILDITAQDGLFDYIICHGVYSWVPADVQEHILVVCRDNLAPQGVAYISYNTLPGWHLRAGVREMMTFHADRFQSVEDRVGQARALLDFLHCAAPTAESGAYAKLLRDELDVVRNRADSYLFHEHVEEHHEPIYFHEFVGRLRAHELRYLAESSLQEMFPRELSTEAQETLAKICPDQIHLEQYLDFLRNRMFRRTLICHEATIPQRDLLPDAVSRLLFGAELKPKSGTPDAALNDDTLVTFEVDGGGNVHLEIPFAKRLMQSIGHAWPAFVDFETLASRADELLGNPPGHAQAAANRARGMQVLLECTAAGLLSFRVAPVRFATSVSECPVASPLARLQVQQGSTVTTLRHVSRPFPEHVVHLIGLLDGTRDHDELATAVAAHAIENGLAVTIDGKTHEEPEELRAALTTGIDRILRALCWDGLLIE